MNPTLSPAETSPRAQTTGVLDRHSKSVAARTMIRVYAAHTPQGLVAGAFHTKEAFMAAARGIRREQAAPTDDVDARQAAMTTPGVVVVRSATTGTWRTRT